MKTASKPLIVNVTAEEKRHIARMANAWGISMEAFVRRAAMSYCRLGGTGNTRENDRSAEHIHHTGQFGG